MQLWLIPILPLAGFLINGLFGRRLPKALINTFAIGSVVLSFAWVVKTLLGLGEIRGAHRALFHLDSERGAATSAGISRWTG